MVSRRKRRGPLNTSADDYVIYNVATKDDIDRGRSGKIRVGQRERFATEQLLVNWGCRIYRKYINVITYRKAIWPYLYWASIDLKCYL